MAQPSCDLLATAFLVGYGLPSSASQAPPFQQRRAVAPLDRLSVRRVRVTKRTRVKVMVLERSLYLLAGGLDPGHFKISSEERRGLRWELNMRRTFLHRCAGRRGFQKICRIHGSARSEEEDASAAEPLFIEGEHPALCGKKASGDSANQPAHRAEKKGRLPHSRARPGDGNKAITGGQFPSKSISSRSPDEIQHYMRMKSQLRTKEQKEAAAQAHAAAVARKEKMKALEIERRARLRLEAISGKGRSETPQRPQWDSSTLTPASEVNGPWSNVADLTVAVDFPLPKPVDADGFSSLCSGRKSSLESLQDSTEASENVLEVSKVNAGRSSDVAWWPSEKSSQGKHKPANNNQCRVYCNKNLVSQQAFEETKSIRTPIDFKASLTIAL